jgi:CMP-N-acetylneuraminic acid synthetase
MKPKKNVAVIVQARLQSERVPAKMVKPFAGTCLLEIALKKVLKSLVIKPNQFFLAAHEPELLAIGENLGVNIFHRSRQSAHAEGVPLTLLYEWWNQLPFEYAILINACNPLLRIETIDAFFNHYSLSSGDGLFGVMKKKNYLWHLDGSLATESPGRGAAMDTKLVSPYYEAAHCLYAGRLDRIGDGLWMGDLAKPGDIELFEIDELEAFDIDYGWQFNAGEVLYKSLQATGGES